MEAATQAALLAELGELRQEVGKLRGELVTAQAKERELRALISYLNNLGPKPENLKP